MDNSKVGTYVTDGTVVWIIDDMRDGTPVGSVRGSLFLPHGYIKANGATVNRADYPRLVKFIETNNLWTDDISENLGLFGKGDGSTTLVLPNYVGRMVTYKDTGAGQTLDAGLPNITGESSYSDDRAMYGVLTDYSITKGAIYAGNKHGNSLNGSSSDTGRLLNFDASRSNAIYGASDTVQPPAISLIPVIRY